jgi:hypothetical protein
LRMHQISPTNPKREMVAPDQMIIVAIDDVSFSMLPPLR